MFVCMALTSELRSPSLELPFMRCCSTCRCASAPEMRSSSARRWASLCLAQATMRCTPATASCCFSAAAGGAAVAPAPSPGAFPDSPESHRRCGSLPPQHLESCCLLICEDFEKIWFDHQYYSSSTVIIIAAVIRERGGSKLLVRFSYFTGSIIPNFTIDFPMFEVIGKG